MAKKTPGKKPFQPTPEQRIAGIQAQADKRLANLAMELGLAAVQVLREEYGFSTEMADAFLGKMLDRARANREAGAAKLLEKWAHGDK